MGDRGQAKRGRRWRGRSAPWQTLGRRAARVLEQAPEPRVHAHGAREGCAQGGHRGCTQVADLRKK